ncbi:hypothetical protein HPP92_004890 [Vanilla planifolia]|uniref:Uncharacterized protein n=1 Tax=Vanilla planifolia TaxID=51239 RepID=A0A835RT97_VANPL|nr:hypothetical protein HPP92_004890 [Vanilla planifolia]
MLSSGYHRLAFPQRARHRLLQVPIFLLNRRLQGAAAKSVRVGAGRRVGLLLPWEHEAASAVDHFEEEKQIVLEREGDGGRGSKPRIRCDGCGGGFGDGGGQICKIGELGRCFVGSPRRGAYKYGVLPVGAVVIQVVPFGSLEWLARDTFMKPVEDLELKYLAYGVGWRRAR